MTCKDCIHCDVCKWEGLPPLAEQCEDFKDKSRYIELPCKVGDMLYYIATCKTAEDFGKKYVSWERVKQISINAHGKWVYLMENSLINFDEIGKVIFLTKEEAEKALAERSEQ